jgi:hypothetical protein
MSRENPYLQWPATDLTKKAKPGQRVKVTYAVSQTYNGGVVHNGEWFVGYVVPPPIIPRGFKLESDYGGLQLNCSPPQASAMMVPV